MGLLIPFGYESEQMGWAIGVGSVTIGYYHVFGQDKLLDSKSKIVLVIL